MKEKKSPIRFSSAVKVRERTDKNIEKRVRNSYVQAHKAVAKILHQELREIRAGIEMESNAISYQYRYTIPNCSQLARELLVKEIAKRLDKYGYNIDEYGQSLIISW